MFNNALCRGQKVKVRVVTSLYRERKLPENTYSQAEILKKKIVWNAVVHRAMWNTNTDKNSMFSLKKKKAFLTSILSVFFFRLGYKNSGFFQVSVPFLAVKIFKCQIGNLTNL